MSQGRITTQAMYTKEQWPTLPESKLCSVVPDIAQTHIKWINSTTTAVRSAGDTLGVNLDSHLGIHARQQLAVCYGGII